MNHMPQLPGAAALTRSKNRTPTQQQPAAELTRQYVPGCKPESSECACICSRSQPISSRHHHTHQAANNTRRGSATRAPAQRTCRKGGGRGGQRVHPSAISIHVDPHGPRRQRGASSTPRQLPSPHSPQPRREHVVGQLPSPHSPQPRREHVVGQLPSPHSPQPRRERVQEAC